MFVPFPRINAVLIERNYFMRVLYVFNAVLDNRILVKYQTPTYLYPVPWSRPRPFPNFYSVVVCKKLATSPLTIEMFGISATINVVPHLELEAITFGMAVCYCTS